MFNEEKRQVLEEYLEKIDKLLAKNETFNKYFENMSKENRELAERCTNKTRCNLNNIKDLFEGDE